MGSMIMTALLFALVLFGTIGTVVTLVREGRGPAAPPMSHRLDRRFLPPANGGSRLA
jgi:hypothetical protein